MPTKKSPKNHAEKKQVKFDQLTKRTIQITGFSIAIALLIVRTYASLLGLDSGISEILIAGFAGMGAAGSWIKT